MMNPYIIRTAKENEVDGFLKWGEKSGWQMGAEFTKNFYKDYPNGWFVGEITSPGSQNNTTDHTDKISKIVAKLYCVKYTSQIGFIGFFIVDEEWRGKAYGYQLIKYVLDNYLSFPPEKTMNLGEPNRYCKAVGLYSATSAVSYYQKLGFKLMDQAMRFKGIVDTTTTTLGVSNSQIQLDSVANCDLEAVARFDESYSQAYRPGFWNNWGTIYPKNHCLVYKNAESGRIEGLGAVRPLPSGFRLGPIYAPDLEIAQLLFWKLYLSLPENSVITCDVLQSNSEGAKFLHEVGLKNVSEAGYMWKGDEEFITKVLREGKKIYALASLDFN